MRGSRRHTGLLALLLLGLGALPAQGTGITADVGMTPPLGRWIFRTQVRLIELGEDATAMERSMSMRMMPVMLAHGLRPELTVIGRQMFINSVMSMGDTDQTDSGRGDFALIAKYRLLRKNSAESIFALAPILGLELPSGDADFGSDTWDLLTGLFLSARRGALGADLNLELRLEGLDDRDGTRAGDSVSLNLALAPQLTLDAAATTSLWPVLELLYESTGRTRAEGMEVRNSGGDLMMISTGFKFARQSLMLESLLQIPMSQDMHGSQLKRTMGGMLGLRILF